MNFATTLRVDYPAQTIFRKQRRNCGLVKNCAVNSWKKTMPRKRTFRMSWQSSSNFYRISKFSTGSYIQYFRVQLAYCLQMQGRAKEAGVIYAEALKNKPTDPALIAVASNNSVVINKDQNMFDSKKKMRAAMVDACEHKLTNRQKKSIALNNCLLALFTNQADFNQLLTKLIAKYPDLEYTSVLINASAFVKDKKYKDAVDCFQKFASKNTKYAFETKFAIVQLHLLSVSTKYFAIRIVL